MLWSGLFTKLSVLLFYRRLVAGTASFRFKVAIWAAMIFVTLYTVIFSGILFLNCTPFSGIWQQYDVIWLAIPGNTVHCLPIQKQFDLVTVAAVFSVFTDWYSVMLPAVLLLRIRMNVKQKYGLMFIFGLGYW
jgi:hypothetical protein